MSDRRFVPLFWRLFVPNATVLCVACAVLILEPANGRIIALVGALVVMLTANLLLMRAAFVPLARLTALMGEIDPLRPGQRVPTSEQASEVTMLADAFNDMLDRLEHERRESGRRALVEREGERRRLAAELHDEIGQTLTALALRLDRLAAKVPEEARGEALELRDAALGAVDDVRDVVRRLRPEALDALGLVAALNGLIDRLGKQAGLRIVGRLDRDLPELPSETELVLFRIAQESLTNVIRHANASEAEVVLERVGDRLTLVIRDDGDGIEDDEEARRHGGSGVRVMRERAMLIGADLSIGQRPDRNGTEVRLSVGVPPGVDRGPSRRSTR